MAFPHASIGPARALRGGAPAAARARRSTWTGRVTVVALDLSRMTSTEGGEPLARVGAAERVLHSHLEV